LAAARDSFVSSLHTTALVGAVVVTLRAVVVAISLPARACRRAVARVGGDEEPIALAKALDPA
jgi:hypothetical protein